VTDAVPKKRYDNLVRQYVKSPSSAAVFVLLSTTCQCGTIGNCQL